MKQKFLVDMRSLILLALLGGFCGVVQAIERHYEAATVYVFLPSEGELFYEGSPTAEDLRQHYSYRIDVRDPAQIANLLEWLKLDEMKPTIVGQDPNKIDQINLNIVIDIKPIKRPTKTYVGSFSNLYSIDFSRTRNLDCEFALDLMQKTWLPLAHPKRRLFQEKPCFLQNKENK